MTRYTPRSNAPTQKVQAAPAVASQIYLLLIPDAEHRRLLVYPSDRGWTLPRVVIEDEGGWALPTLGLTTPRRTGVLDTLEQESGLRLTLLHQFDVTQPSTEKPLQICTLENHSDKWQPPSGGRWIEAWELGQLCFRDATEQTAIDSWFAETTGGGEPLVPWWQPGWWDEAVAWAEAQLAQAGIAILGPARQVTSWYRSSVLKISTDAGDAYFKAASQAFAHEAPLTQLLAGWSPAHLPTLIAVDPQRGWMLTLDIGGAPLVEEQDAGRWEEALRAYARLQIGSLSRIRALLEVGCLDLRLDRMAVEVEAFFSELPRLMCGSPEPLTPLEQAALTALPPHLRDLCAAALESAVPCGLDHGDFHAYNNVRVTTHGPYFFDWQEGCVTHPFFSLASFLSDADRFPGGSNLAERLRDAYFDEWPDFLSLEACRMLLELIRPLWLLYLAFQDRGQLTTWWRQLGSHTPLPLTATEWSIRQRQRCLSERLRLLLAYSREHSGL